MSKITNFTTTEKTVQSITNALGSEADAIFTIMKKSNGKIVIGGSCVTRALSNETFEIGDIDIFIEGDGNFSDMKKLFNNYVIFTNNDCYNMNNILYVRNVRRKGQLKIQLVCVKSIDTTLLFSQVDISITKCLFDGTYFICPSNYFTDLHEKTFHIMNNFVDIRALNKCWIRIEKYTARGFTPIYPEKITINNLHNIPSYWFDSVLKEYLLDYTSGYSLVKKPNKLTMILLSEGGFSKLSEKFNSMEVELEKLRSEQKKTEIIEDKLILADRTIICLKGDITTYQAQYRTINEKFEKFKNAIVSLTQ